MGKRDLEADLGIARGMKPLNTSEYYEGISLETAQQYMMAAEGWPHAIERAIEAEKQIEELESQVDVLATTLNMYCSPYYDMQKRADKAEALVRELVEALEKAIEEVNHPICGPGSVVGDLEEVLDKAKEVLGDGEVR